MTLAYLPFEPYRDRAVEAAFQIAQHKESRCEYMQKTEGGVWGTLTEDRTRLVGHRWVTNLDTSGRHNPAYRSQKSPENKSPSY